jgi:uncharacterized protein with PIN domain
MANSILEILGEQKPPTPLKTYCWCDNPPDNRIPRTRCRVCEQEISFSPKNETRQQVTESKRHTNQE